MSNTSKTATISSTNSTSYSIVRNKPVADFRYKGTHSKPVRRRIVLTQVTPKTFMGYELREGNTIRCIDNAAIKSFTRSKIVDGTLSRSSLREAGVSITS